MRKGLDTQIHIGLGDYYKCVGVGVTFATAGLLVIENSFNNFKCSLFISVFLRWTTYPFVGKSQEWYQLLHIGMII